jgi:hypothetical protein
VAHAIAEQRMLQFLIGFSLAVFFVAIIYGIDWIAFRRPPKATAGDWAVAVAITDAGAFLMLVLLALAMIAAVAIFCINRIRRMVSGRADAPPLYGLRPNKDHRPIP